MQGQQQEGTCPAPLPREQADPTAQVIQDASAREQAEAGAVLLGGEEGREELLAHLLREAGTAVFYGDGSDCMAPTADDTEQIMFLRTSGILILTLLPFSEA